MLEKSGTSWRYLRANLGSRRARPRKPAVGNPPRNRSDCFTSCAFTRSSWRCRTRSCACRAPRSKAG